MAGCGLMRPDEHDDVDLDAVRASDPDPLGLMDVIELIAPGARVTGWHAMAGGTGHAMHRIEVTMPSGATTTFVLRRYLPEVGHGPGIARQEAATLEALRSTPVAAPEVLWLDADGAAFDRPALAMTALPGDTRTTDAGTSEVTRGLAEALVSLRWVPTEDLDHLDPVTDPLDDPLCSADGTSPLVDVDRLRAALVDHAPAPAEALSLSHGDFHVGNVLFAGDRVTAIVDWDHARLADARADVAYCALDLALVSGPDAARGFLDAYAALRGPMPDEAWWRLRAAMAALPDPRDWVPPWHALGVAVTGEEVTARFVAWVRQAMSDLGA